MQGFLVVDNTTNLDELFKKFKYQGSFEGFCKLIYKKYNLNVLDRRDCREAEYSETDAQHDYDFLNESAVASDIL